MAYSSLLTPRPEVLSEAGVEPIIDLANVEDTGGRKLESRPAEFFNLTYPTADYKRVIQALNARFAGKSDAAGLYLFEGLKGSGKSHLLVTILHLFRNPALAQAWLAKHGMTCALPAEVVVVHNKFTDKPLSSIWDFVFTKLTGREWGARVVQPSLSEIQAALGDRQLVLILDELEQGIRSIADPAVQNQNIAFLQMLSEFSQRSTQVTLFASIYSTAQEPGETLKRVPSLRVQFAQASENDRAGVVLHRLFENYLGFDSRSAVSTIDSYVNYWERNKAFKAESADDFRARLVRTFPFTPDLLDVLLKRVPASGGFQNVRGALGFLANLVRLTHTRADLISPGEAALTDRENTVRLGDLDRSGALVEKAIDNLAGLAGMRVPFADAISAAALLYTLASTGRDVGATREELIRASLQPGSDINNFEAALVAFQKYAPNFHENAGRYYFDLEENADAKVELHSLSREYGERAPEGIRKIWLSEVFREATAVVYNGDEAATREAVEMLDKGRVRWILAPRSLTQAERHALYFGLAARNEVILLEPKDPRFDLDRQPDVAKWIKRSLAARDLATRAKDRRKEDYERIARDDRANVVAAIKRAGLTYKRWVTFGSSPLADEIEDEPLGNAVSKEEVMTVLSQKLYPPQIFEEHLRDRLSALQHRTVKDIDLEYRNTLGFPVTTHTDRVKRALIELCVQSRLSVNHQRGNFCGRTPQLGDREWPDAVIDAPFVEQTPIGPATRSQPITPPLPFDTPPIEPRPIEDTRPIGSDQPVELEMAPAISATTLEDIAVLPQRSVGELRQAIAERLQAKPAVRVQQAQFTIVLDQSVGDLSTLPAALRGTLSGPGDLFAEINLTRRGDFSKAEIEQLVERLPAFSGAEYRANLKVLSTHD